jgi:CspA family cold shock protein
MKQATASVGRSAPVFEIHPRLIARLDETANFQSRSNVLSHRPSNLAQSEPDAKGTIMAIGTVKFFNTAKGFGFISPEGGGKDVFVHATAVEKAGMRSLAEGQRVSFDIQPDARGSKAVNLKSA